MINPNGINSVHLNDAIWAFNVPAAVAESPRMIKSRGMVQQEADTRPAIPDTFRDCFRCFMMVN